MLAAFGFSKLHIRGKEIYFWMMLACLTLPEVVLLTPLFATTLRLGLYDTYWAVVLPLAALQMPFAVLLARNFIDGIPDELFEAARVDGASVFTAFRYIIVPLTRPIAAAIVDLDADQRLERLSAAAGVPAGPGEADDHAAAAVLRQPVQQRPDQGPGLARSSPRSPRSSPTCACSASSSGAWRPAR